MMNKKDPKVINVWKSMNSVHQPNDKKDFQELINKMTFLLTLGPFYYFVINMSTRQFDYVSKSVYDVLGVGSESFTLDTIFGLYHPKDFEKLHEKEAIIGDFLYNRIVPSDAFRIKAVYLKRLRHTNGNYKIILHQVIALNISDDGKIQHSLVIHTDVTHLNIPIDHKVSFIVDDGPSYYSFEKGVYFNLTEVNNYTPFTKREKEVIMSMSDGKDYNEIAEELYISPHTVRAHKRNILKKSGCKNTAELVAKCVREGVI